MILQSSYLETTSWDCTPFEEYQKMSAHNSAAMPPVPEEAVANVEEIIQRLPGAEVEVLHFYKDPFVLIRYVGNIEAEEYYICHFGDAN